MTDLHEELLNAGWRQGAILTPVNASNLIQETGIDFEVTHLAIVASHSCDLLSSDLDKEPFVELLLAEICSPDELDGNYKNRHNPRELHCEYLDNGEKKGLKISILKLLKVPRRTFRNMQPDKDRRLTDETTERIALWLSDRYIRSALPDSFNRLVDKRKIKTLLKQISVYAAEIRIAIDPERELQAGESYAIDLTLLVRLEKLKVDNRLKTLFDSLQKELEKLGIEVEGSIKTEDESKFSLIRQSKRWHLDFISEARPDQPKPANPV